MIVHRVKIQIINKHNSRQYKMNTMTKIIGTKKKIIALARRIRHEYLGIDVKMVE